MDEKEEDKQRHELEVLLRETWIKEDPIAIRKVDPERLGLLMVNIQLYVPNNCNAEVIGAPVPSLLVRKLPTGLYQLEGVVVSVISEKEQEYGFFRRRTRPREECVEVDVPARGHCFTFEHGLSVGVFRKIIGPYEKVIPVYAPLPYDVFARNPLHKDI